MIVQLKHLPNNCWCNNNINNDSSELCFPSIRKL